VTNVLKDMIVFLDANALYTVVGRKKLFGTTKNQVNRKRLSKELDTSKCVLLPATTLTEVFVKFKDDLPKLSLIFKYLLKNSISITASGPTNYTKAQLDSFIMSNGVSKKLFLDNVLIDKINIESGFAYTFMYSMIITYADFEAQNRTLTRTNFVNIINNNFIEPKQESDLQELKDELTRGYKIDSAMQKLKLKFVELLDKYFITINGTILNLKNNASPSDQQITIALNSFVQQGLGTVNTTIMSNIKQIKNNINSYAFITQSVPQLLTGKGYTQKEIDYLKIRYESWVSDGQRLRKNDIYDFLFFGVYSANMVSNLQHNLKDLTIQLTDIIPLSFDTDMMNYIKTFITDFDVLYNSVKEK
jgi:hypothetical protein